MSNLPAARLMDPVVGIDIHLTASRLQKLGVSTLGALQVLQAQPVSFVADRRRLAEILTSAVSSERR